jgi:hypothetical protein
MENKLLNELFEYNPVSGIVIWKTSRCNKIKVGNTVSHRGCGGYIQVRIEGRLWMLHRIIWKIQTGNWPTGFIDHINGIRDDNSWSNLRDVTPFVNGQNRKGPDKDSTTGYLGVCFCKQSKKFKAQMTVNKIRVLNKLFDTPEEASNAYQQAKEKYHHI